MLNNIVWRYRVKVFQYINYKYKLELWGDIKNYVIRATGQSSGKGEGIINSDYHTQVLSLVKA